MTHKPTTRIVILGAGYAGMMAAVRLAGKTRRQNAAITLVNASDVFVERLRLHEAAVGKTLKVRPLAAMLRGTGVELVQGWAEAIHRDRHEVAVRTETGTKTLPYDMLVYALGSRVNQEAVPGVRDRAYALNPHGTNDAHALKARLMTLAQSGGTVVVVGGGATGIEAAGEIRSHYPDLQVRLVTEGAFGDFKNNRAIQRYMRHVLEGWGIAIQENTPVTAVHAGKLACADGQTIPFDLCLWAGGFVASPLAGESGLAVDERGRILVDACLRSVTDTRIYAVGDAASPTSYTGAPYRMSVFAALVSGAHTADNLSGLVRGKALKPFSFSYYGQGIALGEGKGIGFATFPDDAPLRPFYTGWLGASVRNFFVWFLVAALEIERRVPGFFFWLGKGRWRRADSVAMTSVHTTGVLTRKS